METTAEKPALREIDLPTFLSRYPWERRWKEKGQPLDFLWRWDFPVNVRQLWPHLIDTSAFNKRLGLPQMEYVERDGRLYGSSINAGMRLEWEEVPWEWEYGKGLCTTRIYSQGFAHCVRARYVLEEPAPGQTRLYVYFGWIPRGFKGRIFIRMSMGWVHKRYDQVLAELVASLQKGSAIASPDPLPALSEESLAELEAARRELFKTDCDQGLVDKLIHHIRSAPDEELLRIRVRALARKWGVPERALLSVVLHATRKGALVLTWDVICPHCRGVRKEVDTLGDVPAEAVCEACGIDFAATGLNSLEATFHVHPSIRKVAPKLYCAAEPATKPHIVLQRSVPAKDAALLRTLLSSGRYRLRIKGRKDYGLLDVGGQTEEDRIEWREETRSPNLSCRAEPAIVLHNASQGDRTFVIEETRLDADALRPADLFTFQDFRDLFSEQSVGYDIQLEVGVQAVLFTDLVGSTRFYETAGDSVAFAQVRQHFIKVFDVVRKNNGAVVKTIGDAAMAAFEHASDALRAAVELQEWFNAKNSATALRIRISLNLGPCLAVNLNSSIDYFGSTVNLAAKLQSVVEAQQIVFPDAVKKDPGAAKYLEGLAFKPQTLEFPLKWSGGKIQVFRLDVA